MPDYPGFIGPSYRSQSSLADIERLVNWYVAKIESPNAKGPYALYPTPGVQDYSHFGSAPHRGLFAQEGQAWAVADNVLAEFFVDKSITPRGTVIRDQFPVTMTTNGAGGRQLFVTSGGHKYILDLDTNVLTDKGPGATSGVVMGDMLGSFFIALEGDRFSISDAYDGLTWDGLQFEQRSTASDPWRAMKVVGTKLYLLGEYTSDIYFLAANELFPFKPVQGPLIPQGAAAVFSVAEFGGGLTWLAQNRFGSRTVQRMNGYSSEKVSSYALDYALSQYARVDDAEAFTYQEQGVEFYVLNLPSANATWVLDKDGGWHERGTWNIAAGRYDVWHPRCHCVAFGKHLVGDRATDALFELSASFGLDAAGAPLRRMRVGPALGRGARVAIDNFALLLDPGDGIAAGDGADPLVVLEKSSNGGKTWGPERRRHAGKIGQNLHRVRWNRLGAPLDPAVRITVTDPVPWRLVGALINEPDTEAA